MEERHKCKLCSRSFSNGRALGGHMKAHLSSLPLPPKPHPQPLSPPSSPSLSSSSDEEQELSQDDKSLSYLLRENPKKNLRFTDPEFTFTADASASAYASSGVVVVQDRESETESKNPTRRRSKRVRKTSVRKFQVTKAKSNLTESPEPVSSVSDTSPEEDVAMCLVMLSRDKWMRNKEQEEQDQVVVERSKKKNKNKHQSDNSRTCFTEEEPEMNKVSGNNNNSNDRIFECPFCYKVFGSGQALGGHKRSHLLPSSSLSTVVNSAKCSMIDLNLPAPLEEDELSVVSDA